MKNITHKNLVFTNCNLTECNLSNTSLSGINLSTDVIDSIISYPQDLKGAIMSEYQALEYIKLLGIKISK